MESDSTVPGVENGLPKEFGPVPSRDPLPTEFHNRILARRVPKAELHCHLQGALRPSQFHTALQRKRSRSISRAEADSAYDFISFNKFFADLDAVCELWGDTHSITLAVLDVLAGAYDLGCRHLELMITPDLHRNKGISPAALLGAAGEAFTIAADTWDMTGGIIVEMLRDRGKDAAIALVRETARLRADGVPILGYGNDGNHKQTPFEDLAPAYRLAREEGYRLPAKNTMKTGAMAICGIAFSKLAQPTRYPIPAVRNVATAASESTSLLPGDSKYAKTSVMGGSVGPTQPLVPMTCQRAQKPRPPSPARTADRNRA